MDDQRCQTVLDDGVRLAVEMARGPSNGLALEAVPSTNNTSTIAMAKHTIVPQATIAIFSSISRSPAGLAREHSVLRSRTWEGRSCAVKWEVVGAPVPDGRVHHTIGTEGHDGADDGAGETVVPVVVLVDGEGAGDERRAEDWGVGGDELPHGWVVVGPDLQLGVEVERKEDEARKGGGRVARREALERVVDLGLVACADGAVVHDLAEAIPTCFARERDVGLADGEEVWAETTDQPGGVESQ